MQTCLKYACALTRSGSRTGRRIMTVFAFARSRVVTVFEKKHFVGGEIIAREYTTGLRCPHNEWSSRHAVNFQCQYTMHLVAEANLTRSFRRFFHFVSWILIIIGSRTEIRDVVFIHVAISKYIGIIMKLFYEFFFDRCVFIGVCRIIRNESIDSFFAAGISKLFLDLFVRCRVGISILFSWTFLSNFYTAIFPSCSFYESFMNYNSCFMIFLPCFMLMRNFSAAPEA